MQQQCRDQADGERDRERQRDSKGQAEKKEAP